MHQLPPPALSSVPPDEQDGESTPVTVPDAAPSEFVGRLFQKYNESLVRYLSVRLCSLPDAEEVAQEAYVRMLKLDEPDAISHLQAYLFKIASNIAIDRLRRQGRQPQQVRLTSAREDLLAAAATVDQLVDARQQLAMIREAVEELPPKCRKAFMLYKFHCHSYKDIAADMNLTESMIRKYVLRAIAYCRARVESQSHDTE